LKVRDVPTPESQEETEPAEEEHTAINIEWIEYGYGQGLSIDRVDGRRLPEKSDVEHLYVAA